MKGRTFFPVDYRYGFNNKEKDDELKNEGNDYDYGYRCYDSRLGRFISIDPLFRKYPHYSSYQFAGNRPIWQIDIDGLENGTPPFAVVGTIRLTPSGGKFKFNYGAGVQVPLNNTTTASLNVNNFQQNNRLMFNGFVSTNVVPGGLTMGVSYTPNGSQVKLFGSAQGPAMFEAPALPTEEDQNNSSFEFTTTPPPKNVQEFSDQNFEDCQEECENVSVTGPEEAKVQTEDGALKINNDQESMSEEEMAKKTAEQINEGVQNSGGDGTQNGQQNTQQNDAPKTIPQNYEEFKRAFLSMPLPQQKRTP